ncbi:hypothetical protein SCHPADRAFT_854167 [Schizopora paradoxa]|uniref:Cupredoxin n=1 Tax=Schizopora paradoxa TaxID=27342 RepID=A0A0H2RJW5_9AGAM|nr:hypothetical protein SCHPADRAFT_854167 [Schizopora paradoxa]
MVIATAVSLALLSTFAAAQTVHQVNVGDNGLFFNPQTITAIEGDIVTFNFIGRNHSVTQSSQDAPCTRLQGGFNSGLLGIGNDTTAPPGVWNLTVTDASQPIWYFCEAVIPFSHCTSGMVGAINPPSNDSFSAFQSSAKAVTETITPTDTVILSGVGAAATANPTTTATAPFSKNSTASSTGTSTSSAQPTNSSSGSVSTLKLTPWSSLFALGLSILAVY